MIARFLKIVLTSGFLSSILFCSGVALAQDTVLQAWWDSFQDPKLSALVRQALSVSNALAGSARRQKRAELSADLADFLPGVQTSGSLSASSTLQDQGGQVGQSKTRQFGIQGNVGYSADLWGKTGAQRDSAAWEAMAAKADRDKAAIDLTAQVAILYWRISLANEQIATARKTLAAARQVESLVRARTQAGVVSELDLAQVGLSVVNQEVELARLQGDRLQSMRTLNTLVDREPDAVPVDESTTISTAFVIPAIPPVSIADGIAVRPDMQALELRLRISRADITIRRADLYPEFTLKANISSSGVDLANMLKNPVGVLVGMVALPLFNWKTTNTQIAQSEIGYEIATLQFRDQMLQALREVSEALSASERLQREMAQREQAVVFARRAEVLSKARFSTGATGIQPWIEAQNLLRSAEIALAQTVFDRLSNRANLYQVMPVNRQ